jgi:hypothetical protein
MTEISIRTVGNFLDHRYQVMVFCSCGLKTKLDLVKLAETKGRDYDLYNGAFERLVCNECGAKGPSVIIELPDRDKSKWIGVEK